MKHIWFKKFGWFHYPISLMGYTISILAIIFCLQIIIFANSRAHSISDFLYTIFPFVVPALLAWAWLADKTSE